MTENSYQKSLKNALDIYEFKKSVIENQVELVSHYLDEGVNVNHRFIGLQTALHLAIENDAKEVSWTLINRGVDVNAIDHEGNSPLLKAIKKGDMVVTVSMLIDNGAEVECHDKKGNSPLMLASLVGNIKASKLLVNAGANVMHFNHAGDSVLSNAILGGGVLHRHFKLNEREMANYLISIISDINFKNKDGDTLLMKSIKNMEFGDVRFLIENGVDPFITNNEGLDAFEYAYEYGNSKIYEYMQSVKEDMLLRKNVQINQESLDHGMKF